MRDEDPIELAKQREREADRLEQHVDEVQSEIEKVRQDWERKRADQGVPGAPPPEGDASDDAQGSPADTEKE
jgi:hypothetical protein